MRSKQKKEIIGGVIFILLSIGLILGIHLESKKNQIQTKGEHVIKSDSNSTSTQEELKNINTSTKVISQTEEKVLTFSKSAQFKIAGEEFVIQVTDSATVYDAMNSLMSEGKMTFKGKEYPGLGFFVTQINSLQSGGGKNLMYYINGTEASQGVSTYIIKEGDSIEWKLK